MEDLIRSDSVQPVATLDSKAPIPLFCKKSQKKGERPLDSTSMTGRDLSRSRAGPVFSHKDWAVEAWTALKRSFLRAPSKLFNLTSVQWQEAQKAFVTVYEKRSKEGTAMKWLKFHTSYIFAYSAGQVELPTAPYPAHEEGEIVEKSDRVHVSIVGGPLGRAIRAVMARGRSGNWACRRCAYDILMCKLGMPPATDAFVEGAYQDHKKALTKDASSVKTGPYDSIVLERVKAKIDEICDDLFVGETFSHKDPIPSMRACQENGLKSAGALGELAVGYLAKEAGPSVVATESLFGMVEVGPGDVRELRFIDSSDLVSSFQDHVDALWISRLDRPLDATPCPILEPLKVRMITKGQAAEYYRTIELQKLMHGVMRKHPVFQYIGHPIDDHSWADAFKTLADLPAGKFYVSGDYKAATDNLNPELSEYAWTSISKRVQVWFGGSFKKLSDTPYYALGIKALCHHRLHYPSPSIEEVIALLSKILTGEITDDDLQGPKYAYIVNQSWGQLMGSPMSFPILCLVNAAASLAALEQPFSRSVSMRVNGDDIGFIADAEEYETWKWVTAKCGLEFSLGKNYTSREFLLMNSELRRPRKEGKTFSYRLEGYEGFPDGEGDDAWRAVLSWKTHPKSWKLEGFLNQSILYHRVKKGIEAGQQKDVYWTELQSLSHEAIRGIPDTDQEKVMGVFLREYAQVISEIPAHCCKWFPSSLGGAGMAIPKGKTLEQLTERDNPDLMLLERRQAAYLACYPAKRMKRISRTKRVEGPIGETLADVLALSNSQVPAVLHSKPRLREQKTMLGGQTLLGYLIRGFRGVDLKSAGGELSNEASQGPSAATVAHVKETRHLNHEYDNWLHGARACSLSPMTLEHIVGYQEHLMMISRIELLAENATSRAIDQVVRCVPE